MLCASWCFNVPHMFESSCLRPCWSMRRKLRLTVSPVVFAWIEGCHSKEPVLLWHFCQFMLWDRAQDDIWLRNSSWHTHTHTHEMLYEMLPQQVQERLTQKSCNRLMNYCTGSIPWSKKSCQSQCSCKHPSNDDDGNSSVLSFGKVGENCKKTWRKYRENIWNILVLPSFFCSGLKLYKRFRWNVIYS